MKKVFLILMLAFCFSLQATAVSLLEMKKEAYTGFVESIIPEEFVEPFVTRTFDEDGSVDIGLELLAMGKKESQWKRRVVGVNRDVEGNVLSYDYGPLQLNSSNISSFSKIYGISWEESHRNRDIYYMCICIDYYKDLRTKYAKRDAWMAYNGGEYRVKNNCVRKVVKEYADDVYEFNSEFRTNWLSIASRVYRDFQILDIRSKIGNMQNMRKLEGELHKLRTKMRYSSKFPQWMELPYWYRREDYFIV